MIRIKTVPASQWKDYKDLRLEALKKDPAAFGSSHEEEVRLPNKEWKKRVKNVLFAVNKGNLVGMIVVSFNKKLKTRHIANLYGFYVKKEYRNRGIGKSLVDTAIEMIKKNKNIIKINLAVDFEQKVALEVYKSRGFKQVGNLKKDLLVNGKFYDEVIMERFV